MIDQTIKQTAQIIKNLALAYNPTIAEETNYHFHKKYFQKHREEFYKAFEKGRTKEMYEKQATTFYRYARKYYPSIRNYYDNLELNNITTW